MLVLGIESTAHTLGVSVVQHEHAGEPISIRSNTLDKFPSTREGFIPRKLAEHHANAYRSVLEQSLAQARVQLRDLDAVAYSQGPGIGHSLRLGYAAAASLSAFLHIPLVPVNHGVAHIEIGRETGHLQDPLVLYVSGGNTQITLRDKKTRHYRVLGETLDIGLGNFLDHVGRHLELSPPDAVGVMNAAKKGARLIELPYSVKGMSVSFTGLLTRIERLPKNERKQDVALSAQETSFAMVTEALERALCHEAKPEVLLVGGNARNPRLQEMVRAMSDEHNARFGCPSFELAGDNGAMIAVTGLKMLEHRAVPRDKKPKQKMRIDEQKITW